MLLRMQKSYPGTLCLRELEPEVLGSSSIEAVLCIENGIKQNCIEIISMVDSFEI
jgi:hypothetical protein